MDFKAVFKVTFQRVVTIFYVNKQLISLTLVTVSVECERNGLFVYTQNSAFLKFDSRKHKKGVNKQNNVNGPKTKCKQLVYLAYVS